jgi:hypothetical protein
VIDDPKLYVIPPPGQTVANLYRVKKQPQKQQVTKNRQQQEQQPNATTQRSASRSNRPGVRMPE